MRIMRELRLPYNKCRYSFMHWSPILTYHNVANGLHSNTPIQVAGGGGEGVSSTLSALVLCFFLPAQAL